MNVIQESALKERLARRGAAIPAGTIAATPENAAAAAAQIGYPVVLKAVIPVGDRGGKGLVTPAFSRMDVLRAASGLLGRHVEGHQVRDVRVEAMLPPGTDYYLAATFDFVQGSPILLWGSGGTGVEHWLVPNRASFMLSEGPEPNLLPSELQPVGRALHEVFADLQARLVELNPVRVVKGEAVVLDAKAVLDPVVPPPPDAIVIGRAKSEHAARLQLQLTELGTTAKVIYEEFTGDVGLVMWGGGSTMIALDALQSCGLSPANYSDMAAGTKQPEVIGLLCRTVLQQGPRGVLAGSTVSSALSAIEIARALDEVFEEQWPNPGDGLPVAVRLAGADENSAKELLERRPLVRHFGRDATLEDAINWLATRMKAA